MEYKALVRFIETQEDDKAYEKDDVFEGTEERIKELSTKNNKAGFPVIEGVPVKEVEEPEKEEEPKKKEKKADKKKTAKGSK